jgi:uncharacterized repeat protein (TIGR02543 family)
LVNSNNQRGADSISDTVDKVIRIGVKAYLPKYINSVTIAITRTAADTDTVITFANPSAWTDTQWISVALHSAGIRTVSAVAVIQGEPNYSVTAKIAIIGKPRTVTYDGNGNTGGTVPTDGNTYQQGASVTVLANTGNLVKTSFAFAGWDTAADGSGISYAAAATFAMGAANVTLYAKWTTSILTVKFNSNGGSAVDSQNVTYNATTSAPTPPTQNGFIFAGWYSDQALTIQFNFMTPITSSITLYAKWTPVYTVTYNGNGNTSGTVPADTNKYTNGATVTVLDNTGSLARTGYTFAGWNTNAAGTGTDRTPGGTFAMGSVNSTLYAKWTINQCTVTFNSNGGSAVASQSVNYGSTAVAPAAPIKRSYVLAGWYSDSLLTNAFSFSTPITAGITLYAKWIIQDADGNVYTEVTIGTQVWMVENLMTTKYNDGTAIPLVTDTASWGNLTTPGYCWYLV